VTPSPMAPDNDSALLLTTIELFVLFRMMFRASVMAADDCSVLVFIVSRPAVRPRLCDEVMSTVLPVMNVLPVYVLMPDKVSVPPPEMFIVPEPLTLSG